MRSGTSLAAALAIVAIATPAGAEPITKSDFNLVYFQGPVTSSSRVIGLAGAFTAIAEWCEGEYANAASPAARPRSSLRAFDYDLCLGFTTPGAFGGNDFENAGRGSTSSRFLDSTTLNLGLQIIYRMFGATVNFDTYTLGVVTGGALPGRTDIGINRFTTSAAVSLLGGQLLLGLGLRTASLDANETVEGTTTRELNRGGVGFQIGAIVAPHSLPFRVGATARGPIVIDDTAGQAGGKILPQSIVVPWEIELGGAIELGARTFNTAWVNPAIEEDVIADRWQARARARLDERNRILAATAPAEREAKREALERAEKDLAKKDDDAMDAEIAALRKWRTGMRHTEKRQTAIVMASLLFTGAVSNAVSVTGFIDQQRIPYGGRVSVSPRIGLEGELIKNWVMVRAGSYLEPSLFADVPYRAHFTGGFDLKLFVFNPFGIFGADPWRIRVAVDVASRYFNTSFSLGKYY